MLAFAVRDRYSVDIHSEFCLSTFKFNKAPSLSEHACNSTGCEAVAMFTPSSTMTHVRPLERSISSMSPLNHGQLGV